MIDFRNKTINELEQFMKSIGEAAYRGRQLFKWIWKPQLQEFSQITEFSKGLRKKLASFGYLYELRIATEKVSKDGTVKWGFVLRDGNLIESVLIPERTHYTLCVSSQVGCGMGCRFCRTGLMGFIRNLTPSEIALQALMALKHKDDRLPLRNIVFMGMGEPLANLDNLLKALKILTADSGLNFSNRRITISTSGIVPGIYKLGEKSDVGLAISLHATDDDTRSVLMPINRKYPIRKILKACRDYPLPRRRRITFEYLLIDGINDSVDHANRLASLLRGIPSKINLIPFNESEGISFKAPSSKKVMEFQAVLKNLGYTAIIRKSKGSDIMAACGQLCWDNALISKKDVA